MSELTVTLDGVNKVVIRGQRMNTALQRRVVGLAARMATFSAIDMGSWNRALWIGNIKRVEGPLFDGVKSMPLSDEDLDELPSELDELMNQVLAEIQRVNIADPNSQTPASTTAAGS